MIVLDASALLAFLFREEGSERVAEVLGESCMSAVNLSEVIGRFVRDGHSAVEVAERLKTSPIELVPFLSEDAAIAATLIPATSLHGLSLADRACLSLAVARNAPVITADRVWRRLDL
ncbi:MAG: PIN domain-containing protein, partial [Gammaproteobacteria bacterium]